ncbi:hypothetical protein [Orrella marina]|uniref:hypothetical protein n=1 Tax=Orrella marina TaxID=2163011 RepID=UPI00131F04FF|nr:hypothetical protein [Orrella marina]
MNARIRPVLAMICGVFVIGLAGCQEEEGPAEKAGKEIDKAASQLGDSVEKLGQDIQKATN